MMDEISWFGVAGDSPMNVDDQGADVHDHDHDIFRLVPPTPAHPVSTGTEPEAPAEAHVTSNFSSLHSHHLRSQRSTSSISSRFSATSGQSGWSTVSPTLSAHTTLTGSGSDPSSDDIPSWSLDALDALDLDFEQKPTDTALAQAQAHVLGSRWKRGVGRGDHGKAPSLSIDPRLFQPKELSPSNELENAPSRNHNRVKGGVSGHKALGKADEEEIDTIVTAKPPRTAKPKLSGSASPKKISHARKTDPEHIPRPRNAFILFRKHVVDSKLIPTSVEMRHQNVSIITAKMWAEAPPEQKAHFNELARIEKEEHAKKYPGYRYQPVYRRSNVIRRRVRKDAAEEEKCQEVADLLINGKTGKELESEIKEKIKRGPVSPLKKKSSSKKSSAAVALSKGALRALRSQSKKRTASEDWSDARSISYSVSLSRDSSLAPSSIGGTDVLSRRSSVDFSGEVQMGQMGQVGQVGQVWVPSVDGFGAGARAGVGAPAGVSDGSAMGGMWGFGAEPQHIGAMIGAGMESGNGNVAGKGFIPNEGWVLQNHGQEGQLYATQWHGGEWFYVFYSQHRSTEAPKDSPARLGWYAEAALRCGASADSQAYHYAYPQPHPSSDFLSLDRALPFSPSASSFPSIPSIASIPGSTTDPHAAHTTHAPYSSHPSHDGSMRYALPTDNVFPTYPVSGPSPIAAYFNHHPQSQSQSQSSQWVSDTSAGPGSVHGSGTLLGAAGNTSTRPLSARWDRGNHFHLPPSSELPLDALDFEAMEGMLQEMDGFAEHTADLGGGLGTHVDMEMGMGMAMGMGVGMGMNTGLGMDDFSAALAQEDMSW